MTVPDAFVFPRFTLVVSYRSFRHSLFAEILRADRNQPLNFGSSQSNVSSSNDDSDKSFSRCHMTTLATHPFVGFLLRAHAALLTF